MWNTYTWYIYIYNMYKVEKFGTWCFKVVAQRCRRTRFRGCWRPPRAPSLLPRSECMINSWLCIIVYIYCINVLYIYIYIYIYYNICINISINIHICIYTHTHTYIYIYRYIYQVEGFGTWCFEVVAQRFWRIRFRGCWRPPRGPPLLLRSECVCIDIYIYVYIYIYIYVYI